MEEEIYYEVLTPNNMIENKAEDALKFALEEEQVKNIAITGQYSSGKSSIIQTYFGKYVDKKDYLNISLATFEKIEDDENPIEESNSLEKIIIEKLYYSILNKYDKQRNIISAIIAGIVTTFINAGIYIFNIESINNSFVNNFWVTLIFIILEIICLTSAIAYSISYVIDLQKIKLKLGDVEVEVNKNGNKETSLNLLNEEMDFIVKTMNIAKYKYIVFEDLDRFQNPKIFERLRDLNIILNSTLKQKVKFIYAIKDEMFIADNRTKFFDFIIPVVPYVSYENSGEELLKIIKKHKLDNELSEDFILDISLYISDMRILKNTINEYIIYKKTLDKKLPDYEKLFSILLYKNTCSEDFAKLANRDGEIYKCFFNKNKKIKEYIAKNEIKIEKKKEEYDEVQRNLTYKNNIKELAIYMIKKTVNNNNTITLKNTNYSDVAIRYDMDADIIDDDMLFSENTTIQYIYNNSWKTENLSDFFKERCPKFFKQYKDYKEGIDNIKENINSEIEKIKKEIEIAKEYTLCKLMQKDKDVISINLGKYSDLVKYLLNNGYIDENYNTYINKFHVGSITEKDYNFIMNVRNGKENDYKEKLDNSIKIVKRLKDVDFRKDNILNINILDKLLENEEYIEKQHIYFNTLIESNKYIEFIKDCICESIEFENKKKLIKNLCELDKNILKKVQQAKIEQRYKNQILENIVIETEILKLKDLNNINETIKYIEENNLLKDTNLEVIKNKIMEFDIKYYNISELKNNIKLYRYIIDNNMYQINYENISEILIDREKDNKKEIEDKNYEQISNDKKLKEYIDSNIQFYMDNVYTKLQNKQKNSIKIIKELLNNNDIKLESKQIIIEKETNQIDEISDIEDNGLWKIIFDNNLIKIEWSNINNYYEKSGLDEIIITIFNDEEKRRNILIGNILIENETSLEFIKNLLLSNDLSKKAYELILEKSKYKLEDAIISELDKERVVKLVSNKRIEFNTKMIESIRSYSTEMLILFIKNNYSSMHKEIDNNNIIFNLNEISEILKSDVTPTIKSKCIRMITDEDIENMTTDLTKNIASISIENNFKEILNEIILLKVISDIQDIDVKVKLLNLNFKVLNKENIENYLSQLGENYSKIIIDRTRPKIIDNKHNKLLLKNIEELGYRIKYEIKENTIILGNTIR